MAPRRPASPTGQTPAAITSARLRMLVLLAHVTSSAGWIGAVAAFLALAVGGLTSPDAAMVRVAYLAMDGTAVYIIAPLALASLLIELLITVVAVVVLLEQVAPIGYLSGVAAQTMMAGSDLFEARISLVVHAGDGMLVLVAAGLSVYKPRGRTRCGQRKQRLAAVP